MIRPFVLDLGWAAVLGTLGIDAADLLHAARLPADLFQRARPTLELAQFERLWTAMCARLDTPAPGLQIRRSIPLSAFSPPLFAGGAS